MPFIERSIKSLKEVLNENGTMLVLGEEGFTHTVKCTFNAPLKETEITDFIKKTNFIFPKDYQVFLKTNNGAKIFEHLNDSGENIGGGLHLYSLDEIEKYSHLLQVILEKELSFYPIGYLEGQYLVIDYEQIKQHNPNYLFLSDETLELVPLQLNFELFFDRFILCQGAYFWQWRYITAENY